MTRFSATFIQLQIRNISNIYSCWKEYSYLSRFTETSADEPEAIVGGMSTVPGEFPYQCSLHVDNGHMCGCSILSMTKILTAAHCLYNIVSPPYTNLIIRTGSIDHSQGNAHVVKSAKIHSKYQPFMKKSWLNDIAVITVSNIRWIFFSCVNFYWIV